MRNLIFIIFNLIFNFNLIFSFYLKSNESEIISLTLTQINSLNLLSNSLKKLLEPSKLKFKTISNLFQQQNEVYPINNLLQLNNFGSIKKWYEINEILHEKKGRKLLIMIRHAQAWENLNPLSNENCEFIYNNKIIQNFDSTLSDEGLKQTIKLNKILNSIAPFDQTNNQNLTWFETMGLNNQIFITSPLSRTLQTSNHTLYSLPISRIITSEIIRASIGKDVCNFRHSVSTSTAENPLPPPWNTGCKLPKESLLDLYTCTNSNPESDACKYPTLPFKFPIRPPGGDGIGLTSDYDQLWRSDTEDSTHIERSLTFLSQLYEYFPDNKVIGIITHGEMIQSIYESLGEVPYGPKNTQIVPIMIELAQDIE